MLPIYKDGNQTPKTPSFKTLPPLMLMKNGNHIGQHEKSQ